MRTKLTTYTNKNSKTNTTLTWHVVLGQLDDLAAAHQHNAGIARVGGQQLAGAALHSAGAAASSAGGQTGQLRVGP